MLQGSSCKGVVKEFDESQSTEALTANAIRSRVFVGCYPDSTLMVISTQTADRRRACISRFLSC